MGSHFWSLVAKRTNDGYIHLDQFLDAADLLKQNTNCCCVIMQDTNFLVCLPGIVAPTIGLLDYFIGPLGDWSVIAQNAGYFLVGVGVLLIIGRTRMKEVRE